MTAVSMAVLGVLFANAVHATCNGAGTATITCFSPPTDTTNQSFIFPGNITATANNWQMTGARFYVESSGAGNSATFIGTGVTATGGIGDSAGVIHSAAIGAGGNASLEITTATIEQLLSGHGLAAHANNTTGNATLSATSATITMAAAAALSNAAIALASGSGSAKLTLIDSNVTAANSGAALRSSSASGSSEVDVQGGTIRTSGADSHGISAAAAGAGAVTVNNSSTIITTGTRAYGIAAGSNSGAVTITNRGALNIASATATGDIHGISGSSSTGTVNIDSSNAIILTGGSTSGGALIGLRSGVGAGGSGDSMVTYDGPGVNVLNAMGSSGTLKAAVLSINAGSGKSSIDFSGDITVSGEHNIQGLEAQARGGGDVSIQYRRGTINVTGTVGPSDNGVGISAWTGRVGGGAASVTTDPGTIINGSGGGTPALLTSSFGGTKDATAQIASQITSRGTKMPGLLTEATGGTATTIYIGPSITTKGADSYGIQSTNTGAGAISVTSSGNIFTNGATSHGINASSASGAIAITNNAEIHTKGVTGSAGIQATSSDGGAVTINNTGVIDTLSDVAIITGATAAGTVAMTNSGQITGSITSQTAATTLINSGTWGLRNLADTTGDGVRDTKAVAVSNLGASGTNSITNSGTLSLSAASGAAALNTSGMYLPLSLVANTVTLAGPAQGQILGDKTFTNTGTLDMQANSVAGDVLVISGGSSAGTNGGGVYVTGGTLKLDTVANAGDTASQSDVLVVDSTQIGGGPTALNINMTGLGAQTTGDGILVVQVLGTSVANAFSLASPITVGGYTYNLHQGGLGGSNPGNWYLRSGKQQITLTKSTSSTTLTPGGTVIYTVTVANSGALAVSNVQVSDPVATGIASQNWACAGTACPAASGTGAISQTITSLPVGDNVIYTITATVSGTPPANVTNTATATASGAVCGAAGTPSPCTASAAVPPVPVVQTTKSSNSTQVIPGGQITYTVTVANVSMTSASNVVVSDPLPAGITAYNWTCAGNSATCPNASGNGAINETILSLPASSSVVYTITATVSGTPPGSITNVATTTVPGGGLCAPGNTSSPCTASISITSALALPIPAAGNAALALLAMLLALIGLQPIVAGRRQG